MIRAVTSRALRSSKQRYQNLTFAPAAATTTLDCKSQSSPLASHDGPFTAAVFIMQPTRNFSGVYGITPIATTLVNQQQRRNLWSLGGGKKSDAEPAAAGSVNSSDSSTTFTDGIEKNDASAVSGTTFNFADNNVPATEGQTEQPSVEETLDRLFEESQSIAGGAEPWTGDAAAQAAEIIFDPTWYNLADQAIVLINGFHNVTGLNYGWSIVGLTCIMRIGLFPVMAAGQRTSSRMAHIQPELQRLKKRYENLVSPSLEEKQQFAENMKSLFKRYEVKPFMAFLPPLIQVPLFMGFFFGLRKMPDFFPTELSTGGMFWFTDLTVADPLYILPICCSLTFFATIEMGKDSLAAGNPEQGKMMLNVFRGMSILMVPVIINFHSAMLCYWTTTNLFTMFQTLAYKVPAVKKSLGIWDPPKPVPGAEMDQGLVKAAENVFNQMQGKPTTDAQKIQMHNDEIENRKMAKTTMSGRSRPARRRNVSRRGTDRK